MSLLPKRPYLHNELIHLENILAAYRDGKLTRLRLILLTPQDVVATCGVKFHDDPNNDLENAWNQGYAHYGPPTHRIKRSLYNGVMTFR